jgi:DNA-binding NtrC family response regulator
MAQESPEPLIYIVDDEQLLAEMAETVLQMEGWRTQIFFSAEDALIHFQKAAHPPKLLVTDCVMKKMTGLDLIDRCRQLQPDTKAILLSGTVSQDYVENQQVHPNRFIPKPYRAAELVRAVKDLLREERAENDAT